MAMKRTYILYIYIYTCTYTCFLYLIGHHPFVTSCWSPRNKHLGPRSSSELPSPGEKVSPELVDLMKLSTPNFWKTGSMSKFL